MKKIDYVYSKIIAKENLYRSAYMAAKGRRYRDTTADFNFNLENEVQCLYEGLMMKTYRHGKYRVFTIRDPKTRMISAAPFRDRVVHHAVHDVIEPLIDKNFIYDSYACRKGKGTHKAVDRAQSFLRANRYCLHGDVKKYFPSIDHDILKNILRRRIGDESLLWLLDGVIDSAVSPLSDRPTGELSFPRKHALSEVEGRESIDSHFHGNSSDMKPANQKSLPIGNLTSQFFANLYLNELDYFVKSDLRCRYYIRYMDDFLIFGNDKEALKCVKGRIREFLRDKLNLTLHEGKSQVYKTKAGIKFLGFRIYANYRRLATDNVRRLRKRLKKFAYLLKNDRMGTKEISDSVRCWVAHSRYANTKMLRRRIWRSLAGKNEVLGKALGEILLDGGVGRVGGEKNEGLKSTIRQSGENGAAG